MSLVFFFFFKQKTAYEMRISDWSSDVCSSDLFGAISGSSTASAATLSGTSIPAMIRHKYDPRLASGVVAISGTLAMLIPPSIAIILYGLIAQVSISKLLIAGIIPGLLVTLVLILTVLVLAAINPRSEEPTSE